MRGPGSITPSQSSRDDEPLLSDKQSFLLFSLWQAIVGVSGGLILWIPNPPLGIKIALFINFFLSGVMWLTLAAHASGGAN